MRWTLLAFVAALAAGGWWLSREPWNPRLPPGETARALQARLGTEYDFRCRRVRLQPEIEVNREGTDYLCESWPKRCRSRRDPWGRLERRCAIPGHPEATDYLVATDEDKITAAMPMG